MSTLDGKQNEATRTEEDLLGSRQVPADAYYGIHTLRAMENFHISKSKINDVPEFVRGMVLAKKAAAMANRDLQIIPTSIGDAIVKACDAVLKDGVAMDQFPVDMYQGGAGTSVNMNTNEVLANIALELIGHKKGEYKYLDPNDHVNKCQSTNDAYPTGLRIALYNSIQNQLTVAVSRLLAGIDAKAKEFENIMKMGRTQLQDAVPMSLGQEFHAFSTMIQEEIKNVQQVSQQLLVINMGATAIGTGLNAAPGYAELCTRHLATVSGLPCVLAGDLIGATSDCGAYVNTHGAIKCLATKISKMCNDLRLLSSGPRAGLREIKLPEMQAGSSIMPAKVNPVMPEVVNQVCFKVIGNDTCVTMAAEAGQLQLNVMEPVIAQAMFESIRILSNACLNLQDKCIKDIVANKEVCEQYVLNSIGLVTYLNEVIGHHNGDLIGKACAESGRSVREETLARGLLNAEQIDAILAPANLLHPRYTGPRYDNDEIIPNVAQTPGSLQETKRQNASKDLNAPPRKE